jgi:hypothetical protein
MDWRDVNRFFLEIDRWPYRSGWLAVYAKMRRVRLAEKATTLVQRRRERV